MGLIKDIRNYWFPVVEPAKVEQRNNEGQAKDLRYKAIAPITFSRAKQDIQKWRDAITEAEAGIVQIRQRVRMQQTYLDTILNGHVYAVMNYRKALTLKKGFDLCNSDGSVNEELTKLIKKDWFFRVMEGRLDAEFFGYTLLNFSDIINSELYSRDFWGNLSPIKTIPRPWVSPDRLKVANIPYNLNGVPFRNQEYVDSNGNKPYDWTFYFDTPSENGITECGYGLLYKVAHYEILLRNLLGQFATFVELYGSPMRVGSTMKTGDERDQFFDDLYNAGSSATIVKDVNDMIEFVETRSGASSQDVYTSLIAYLEKNITKMILGHEDAMSSIPGKLGASNEVQMALSTIESKDCMAVEHSMNVEVLPKLRMQGFPIPEDMVFKFRNVKETEEFRRKEDESNKATADIFKVIKDAGGDPDWSYFTERTGIPVEATESEAQTVATNAEKIQNLYAHL